MPTTTKYQSIPTYIDPVQSYINQYCLLLTQYHEAPTSTTPYWPSPPSINHYKPILFLLGDYRLLHSLPRVLFILNSYTEMPQMIKLLKLAQHPHTHIWYRIFFWILGKHYHYRSFISQSMNCLHAIYIFIHQDFHYPGFFSSQYHFGSTNVLATFAKKHTYRVIICNCHFLYLFDGH